MAMGVWESSHGAKIEQWKQRDIGAQGCVNGDISAGAPRSETRAAEEEPEPLVQTLSHSSKRIVLFELKLVSHKAPDKGSPCQQPARGAEH